MKASNTTLLIFTSTFILAWMTNSVIVEGGSSSSVGVNWGRQTSQKLIPSTVVDMLLANGINKVKLFSLNHGVLSALAGSGVEVVVALANIEINNVVTFSEAKAWVEKNITAYRQQRQVDIRYVCIGVEPFEKIERIGNDTSFTELVIPGVNFVQQAIDESEYPLGEKVKVIVPCASFVLNPVGKPSEGDFRDDLKDKILPLLKHLKDHDAPFMIDIHPYTSVIYRNLSIEFGLFDQKSNFSISDGNLRYTNMFDVEYDTLVSALRRYGYGDLKIVVGQVGWPTDGGPGATIQNAKRFYDGLLQKLARNEGTPLQPGVPIEVYLYSLVDENQRRIDRGPFERHYGIYRFDGKPKFNIDFSLQGNETEPEHASGVSYLPQRWCVLKDNKATESNMGLIVKNFERACGRGDCTRLANGSSCSHLDFHAKVSYAFNMFFQMSNQETTDYRTCHFDGLGIVTMRKPVYPDCEFPVLILSTLFVDGSSGSEMQATLGISSSGGRGRLVLASQLQILSPLFCVLLITHSFLQARHLRVFTN